MNISLLIFIITKNRQSIIYILDLIFYIFVNPFLRTIVLSIKI